MAEEEPPVGELASLLADKLPQQRIGRAVAEVMARADQTIAYYGPLCWRRGACCRFGRAGHRLYVTTPELIYFGQTHDVLSVDCGAEVCPHQRAGRCQARRARPLGCRVYFCQASARWWQPAVTERYLRQLRDLGRRFGLPYAYVDWLVGLAALCQAARDSATVPAPPA